MPGGTGGEGIQLTRVGGGAWWLTGKFGALRPEGRGFESHFSSHVGTFGKGSLAVACSASACNFDTVSLLYSSRERL